MTNRKFAFSVLKKIKTNVEYTNCVIFQKLTKFSDGTQNVVSGKFASFWSKNSEFENVGFEAKAFIDTKV